MNKIFFVPTSLIIKSTACLIICFLQILHKKQISVQKCFFFLLHLLQVQQHMMMMMANDDSDENEGVMMQKNNNINEDGNFPVRMSHLSTYVFSFGDNKNWNCLFQYMFVNNSHLLHVSMCCRSHHCNCEYSSDRCGVPICKQPCAEMTIIHSLC